MGIASNRAWRVAKLAERDGFRCWLCHGAFTHWGDVTLDHAIPKSRGGKDGLHNMRLAHLACNNKRADIAKTPPKAAQVRLQCVVELSAVLSR